MFLCVPILALCLCLSAQALDPPSDGKEYVGGNTFFDSLQESPNKTGYLLGAACFTQGTAGRGYKVYAHAEDAPNLVVVDMQFNGADYWTYPSPYGGNPMMGMFTTGVTKNSPAGQSIAANGGIWVFFLMTEYWVDDAGAHQIPRTSGWTWLALQ
jgi:hypothetical protein